MAKEWYLLKPHNQLSGFESDAMDEFAQEGFEELLNSAMATEVELYNYDLSVCTSVKVIVQDNVQDTKLKTMSRTVLAEIGTIKAGMYIRYKNKYWLTVGLVDNNGMYEKAVITLCNCKLTWLNADNKVIQRWASASSASQYNNGETGAHYYSVRSDQLLICTPDDDECILLDSGVRFIIDRRCDIYEKNFTDKGDCVLGRPVATYALTRADSILYNYQDSGHYEFMAFQDEQREDDGYYVIDGKGYWLCGKPQENEKALLSAKIDCESHEIFSGLGEEIFTARFYDRDGEEINDVLKWTMSVESDFTDELSIKYVGNSVMISVDNDKLINKSFNLTLKADGYKSVTETIFIRAFV